MVGAHSGETKTCETLCFTTYRNQYVVLRMHTTFSSDVRNWGTNGRVKYKQICQKICQGEFGKRVYLNQRNAMRAGLTYQEQDHKRAIKRLWAINGLLKCMSENATEFSAEELCHEIVPATLTPRATVECVKRGGEDFRTREEVIDLLEVIS